MTPPLDLLVPPGGKLRHGILLTGGVLIITSPLRAAAAAAAGAFRWSAVVALAAATSLSGFFLSYLSVFVDPGAGDPFRAVPEGVAGHEAAELSVVAGVGGYLLTTILLVVPVLFLRRRGLLPHGAVVALAAAVALPAAALTNLEHLAPAVGAIAAAGLLDLVLTVRPRLSNATLAALLPAALWSGQLFGLALTGGMQWPPELWSGSVLLSSVLALSLALLTQQPLPAGTGTRSAGTGTRDVGDVTSRRGSGRQADDPHLEPATARLVGPGDSADAGLCSSASSGGHLAEENRRDDPQNPSCGIADDHILPAHRERDRTVAEVGDPVHDPHQHRQDHQRPAEDASRRPDPQLPAHLPLRSGPLQLGRSPALACPEPTRFSPAHLPLSPHGTPRFTRLRAGDPHSAVLLPAQFPDLIPPPGSLARVRRVTEVPALSLQHLREGALCDPSLDGSRVEA